MEASSRRVAVAFLYGRISRVVQLAVWPRTHSSRLLWGFSGLSLQLEVVSDPRLACCARAGSLFTREVRQRWTLCDCHGW